jgi:hypothetical protein
MTDGPRRRTFEAYGVRIGLCCAAPAVLDAVDADAFCTRLPPGWVPHHGPSRGVVRWYEIDVGPSNGTLRECSLRVGPDRLAASRDVGDVLRAFTAHAERLIAERAPNHLFVHAAVAGWHGRAVLLPGRSGAGKTTLVRACLDAGATYYSDEYAVLDRTGRVHPYARPLAIRGGAGGPDRSAPAAAFGAPTGIDALPVDAIIVATYRPGARWRPRRLTPGQALLALMDQTVAARGSPAHSMPILRQVVVGAETLAGIRGEAATVADALAARYVDLSAGGRNL